MTTRCHTEASGLQLLGAQMKPKELVAWTFAIGFSLFAALAGIALAHDTLIMDFPRFRALLSIDGQLTRAAAIVAIAALPATFLVFLLGASRGNIEYSVLGIKVKGVAAPPVLWTLVFLATGPS
jgi:hypothetical protein